MPKTKIMMPSVDADAIAMMSQRELVPATDAYETANSTPSIMDEPYVHVL